MNEPRIKIVSKRMVEDRRSSQSIQREEALALLSLAGKTRPLDFIFADYSGNYAFIHS